MQAQVQAQMKPQMQAQMQAQMRALVAAVVIALGLGVASAAAQPRPAAYNPRDTQAREALRNGDYIVAVVNSELVTAGEVERRIERARADAQRARARLPPEAELRQQVVDGLIEERVLITHARDSGARIDDPDLERAVRSVAAQNQLTLEQLRARLVVEGQDYGRFRANLRDQMMVERVREREVYGRIRITDADIDRLIDEQRRAAQADAELNVAQILVTVPEGADAATVEQRRARAESALQRVRGGEPFAAVALALSEDGNRERGGEIGMRPAARLPDIFVDAVRALSAGEIKPELLRSGAGFHVLKVIDRRDGGAVMVTQTRPRHILLRTSPQLDTTAAVRRLAGFKQQIESGAARFEDLARQHSEDGSAVGGGDLGLNMPGTMVPEFEEAMNALPVGGISAPVVSRFGVHLIQVQERRDVALEQKQLRELARNRLREQKFEDAYLEWSKDLRSRAYIELREPPI